MTTLQASRSERAQAAAPSKMVYFFGKKSEGSAKDKQLLGGKGANLAEMCNMGLPVPPGFTISTETCAAYYKAGENTFTTKPFDRPGVVEVEEEELGKPIVQLEVR